MRRRPSDRTLRRWLATGRPRRIGRLVEKDPVAAARLDDLTAFSPSETAALENLVTPPARFEHRTALGVEERVAAYATASMVLDLLGLGYHVGRAVLGDRRKHNGTSDDDTEADAPEG